MSAELTPRSGSAAIGARLRATREGIVEDVLARRGQVAFFAAFEEPALAGLTRDVGRFVDALCTVLEEERPVAPADVAFLERSTAVWTERGARMEDIAHALRVLQRTFHDRTAALAEPDDGPSAVLTVGTRLLELVDVSSAVVGEAWWEREAPGARTHARTELLDALLAGAPPAPGAQAELAASLGLHAGAAVVVVSARAVSAGSDRPAATGPRTPGAPQAAALGALARAGRPVLLPLAAQREGELLVLRVVPEGGLEELLTALERTWRRLADAGTRLALGVSAVHRLPDRGGAALAEARTARTRVAASGGVVALPRLTPLEWLAHRADPTAWQLVPEPVRRFLEEDAAEGGVLVLTLRGYLAADLNLKATARALHLHVNTVRYRLTRIGERTGLDLRHLDDLLQLQVALELDARRP